MAEPELQHDGGGVAAMCAGDPDVRTMMREIEARMRDFPKTKDVGAGRWSGLMAWGSAALRGLRQRKMKHG